jgi:hypothetical protein
MAKKNELIFIGKTSWDNRIPFSHNKASLRFRPSVAATVPRDLKTRLRHPAERVGPV